ncbi:hypothetical protein CEXT_278361 [Caerostris extrusa]|uniref:Ycf15 n=1 Tax=Caerostris extrusa TaxID=172846 RepID=A0AAV4W6N9_CAEEX|nr:hypothetical protein CEXT_278361 [Caerostris extrusa]
MRIITEFLIRSQSYSFRNVGFFKGKAISACSTSGRPCNGDRRPTTAVALLLRIVGRLPIEQIRTKSPLDSTLERRNGGNGMIRIFS